MVSKIIRFSVENKFVVLFLTVILILCGVYSLKNLSIDAIPDLSDTQVIIYSRWDRAPQTIENQVTYPIISGLLGAPKVKAVRGLTDYGFSYVYVIFEEGTDLYWARSRVLEYLARVVTGLPSNVKTELGPDATSVGWVYQYALRDNLHNMSGEQLRTLQDWNLKFHLQAIQGVAEVSSVGGFVKQFQVRVDPIKLQAFHVTFSDVLKAVRDSNQESAGRVLEFSGSEAMVRSSGLIKNSSDLENVVVSFSSKTRTAVLVRDVADVGFGPEERRGVVDLNGQGDAVGGIIVMRQGEDPSSVIAKVKTVLTELKKTLPPGVEIITTYDRSELIKRAIRNLQSSLLEEILIVSLVILIFLWHIPSAIVPILTIPISVLLAFIPLHLAGQTLNIMSLSGIAISIGVLVDGAIVEVENAYKKIQEWDETGRKRQFFQVRLEALLEVGPSVFFSLLVIAIAFLPVFTLVDQEGKLFKPLAYSKNFAMGIAAILAITLDPVMRMLFSRQDPFKFKMSWLNKIFNPLFVGTYYNEKKHPISKVLFKVYEPCVHWVLRHRQTTLLIVVLCTASAIPGYFLLGREFMPNLSEGSFLYMPTALPGLSVTEAQRILQKQGEIIRSFPEVDSVFGKAGRANTSTDTAPLSMIETTIQLKDKTFWTNKPRWYSSGPDFFKNFLRKIWPDFISEEELINAMNEKLRFPGMPNIWTMPIKNRIDMLATGIRSAIGIKIFGADLNVIQSVGEDIEKVLQDEPGIRTIIAERVGGGFFIDVDFNREKLSSLGFNLKEAQDQAMAAIGGENVTTALIGRARFPVQVRLARQKRQNLEDFERIQLQSSAGIKIFLSDVAKLSFSEGPSMVRNENALPVGYVYIDVDSEKTDIGRFVEKAKLKVAEKVALPAGYSLTWSGQFENMTRVKERLKMVIPLTLFLIAFLLYLNTKSWVKTSIILLAVPFSLIGAVWLMWLLGYHISIASWVGMIALMGLDAETGVFMLMYLDLAYKERRENGCLNNTEDLRAAIVEGAVHRVRPKMMTVMALFLGLIPIMWSTGAGSDVMKRIAAPMVGGLFTSFLLELLVYPVLFFQWKNQNTKFLKTNI